MHISFTWLCHQHERKRTPSTVTPPVGESRKNMGVRRERGKKATDADVGSLPACSPSEGMGTGQERGGRAGDTTGDDEDGERRRVRAQVSLHTSFVSKHAPRSETSLERNKSWKVTHEWLTLREC